MKSSQYSPPNKIADAAPLVLHKLRLAADGSMSMPHAAAEIVDIYGLSPEEVTRDFSRIWQRIHPGDHARVKAAIERSARSLAPLRCEWRVRHPDRGEIWVEYCSTPERDADGGIVWYGYYHDITDRKRIEDALRTSEAQLINALKIARAGHWEYDVAGDRFTFNDNFYALLRTTAEQVGGYTMSSADYARKFVHPDEIEIVGDEVRKAIETTDPDYSRELEHRVVFPDGEIGHVAVRFFVVKDDQGRTIKTYGVNQDITRRRQVEQAEEQLALLSFAINHVQDAVYLIDETSRFLYVNDEACRALGYSRDELLDMGIVDIDPVYSIKDDWPKHWNAIQKAGSVTLETLHRHKDGHIFPVEISASYFEYKGQGYNLALARDISERKRTEEQLALLSFALNHVQEAAYLMDEDSRFLYVNDEACRALGYSREELLKLGVVDIDPEFPMEQWKEHWNEIREKGAVTLETIHQRKDGHIFPVEVSANYFEYDGQGYNLALVRDITERKRQEERIEHLAYHDVLTDLPNRSLIMDRLDHALAQAQRYGHFLAVLFIDLDRFKTINDTLGHPVGDAFLQEVAARLVGSLRKTDSIGRLGGDEFLIVVPGLDTPQDAANVTEKIHSSLSTPVSVMGHDLHITASIGVSLYPRDAANAETLVRFADNALYLAKEEGRNTFRFFRPGLDSKLHEPGRDNTGEGL